MPADDTELFELPVEAAELLGGGAEAAVAEFGAL